MHVVIATPGRVLDLMEKKIAVMDRCKVLVLDEVNLSRIKTCAPVSYINFS